MAQLALSYSAATSWRDCEQRYWYRYVDKLRAKTRSAPLSLGNWLHSYLERYYKAIRREVDAPTAHGFALDKTKEQYTIELNQLSGIARALGQEGLAEELSNLSVQAVDIAERYYTHRGQGDSERYEILLVEENLSMAADEGVRTQAVIDLVVRDRDRGVLQMWDHKTTKKVPDAGSHVLDMQQVLYAAMLHEMRGIEVGELSWNYLRTTLPTEPPELKGGGLSKARNLDTDAPTFLAAIGKYDLDIEDYSEVLSRLGGRALSVYFPRHYLPFNTDSERIILGDFVHTAHAIQRAKSIESYRPVRNVGRGCDWCDFRKVCEAAVTGSDTVDIIARNFS